MVNNLIARAYEICPFCGKTVLGAPWDVKDHVKGHHVDRENDFIPHLNAMIRRWLKT
jgi:hypothetical protein